MNIIFLFSRCKTWKRLLAIASSDSNFNDIHALHKLFTSKHKLLLTLFKCKVTENRYIIFL